LSGADFELGFSRVAKITGVSHQRLAFFFSFSLKEQKQKQQIIIAPRQNT
jgi:hypothetical protein